ncbi:MAG: ABC transporter ATP-binding protein [Thermoguttaceae bacterium]
MNNITTPLKQNHPIETVDLTKTYKTGTKKLNAVDNVSLQVNPGEFLMIMGASGSGKSTLIHLMAGLTEPSSGTVLVNGVNMELMSDFEKTRFRLKNIGVIFQAFNLIPTLTAEENILLPSLIEGSRPTASTDFELLLEMLEIKDRRKHRPDSLSGGEQQRVAIGRALIMNPALILADEPTGNLDSANSERLCKLLRNLCDKQNRTIVIVTHDKEVASFGDRCIYLKDGQVVHEENVRKEEIV